MTQAEPVVRLAQPDPAHEAWRHPVGPAGRLIDALVDAPHPTLADLAHQAGVEQALDVVVDPLWALVELGRHLGARPGLGELPQHFDPLRLQQGIGLLDPIEVDDISHDKISLYVKSRLVNGAAELLTCCAHNRAAARGDPIYYRYTVVDRRVVEVRTDTTHDAFGTPAMTTERCNRLAAVGGHLTAEGCVPV